MFNILAFDFFSNLRLGLRLIDSKNLEMIKFFIYSLDFEIIEFILKSLN